MVGVVGHEVALGHLAVFLGGQRLWCVEVLDHVLGDVGEGGRALSRDELHAIVLRRVVARRNLERPRVVTFLGRPRDDGRRRVTVGQQDVEAVVGQDIGKRLREPA